eukprot:SAG31_NODE_42323_length_272_cov_0.601156_1_plen_26_part_10
MDGARGARARGRGAAARHAYFLKNKI